MFLVKKYKNLNFAAMDGIKNNIQAPEEIKTNLFEDTNTKVEALPDTLDCAKDIAMKSEFIKRIIEQ